VQEYIKITGISKTEIPVIFVFCSIKYIFWEK